MRPEAIIRMLEDVGAIRQGHFELTSGLHSGTYVQCALVLQYPKYAEQLGRALAAEFLELVQPFRYPRSLSADFLREVAAMKTRIENRVLSQ